MRTGTTAVLAGTAAGALTAYAITHRDRLDTWGATEEEAAEVLPGDDIAPDAPYCSTRAVTVEAPPEAVWPWVAQLGQGRGGLYSYDWLENLLGLDIHSSDHVLPELQDLAVGDEVRLVPPGTEPDLHFVVQTVQPPSLLVLGPPSSREEALTAGMPYPSWTFVLRPVGGALTRLIVRFRMDYRPTTANKVAYGLGLVPVHFTMERRMLLGIKERAERSRPAPV